MVKRTGDLYPHASGAASLGVEQTNGVGSFTSDIRPYAHVHMNSGVFHDAAGSSGIIRYTSGVLQVSNDGGLNYCEVVQTLQGAYDKGNRIETSDFRGAVEIVGRDTYGMHLQQQEGANPYPHVVMSGIYNIGLNGLEDEALWKQAGSAYTSSQLKGQAAPTNREEIAAQSLGIDTLFYQGGSGVTSVRQASGIATFGNTGVSATIGNPGLILPVNVQITQDRFYAVDAANPDVGIKFLVSGLYRIHYCSYLEKTAGNARQSILTELRVIDLDGNTFEISGTKSAAYMRNQSASFGTCTAQHIGNFRAGEAVHLFAEEQIASGGGQTVIAVDRQTIITIEWIGPMAGGFLLRSPI